MDKQATPKTLHPVRASTRRARRTHSAPRSRNTVSSLAAVFLFAVAIGSSALAQTSRPRPAPFSSEAERCIVPAADYHSVNYDVLRAILVVESSLRANAVRRNRNGSIDVGLAQINSIHFNELGKFGIAPEHLLDACVSTYVAAWHLRKQITSYGNTWDAVARYHSATPSENRRYQVLIRNELIRSGAMDGLVAPIPSVASSTSSTSPPPHSPGVIVSDTE